MLAQAVLVLFALFAMLSLVVDIGAARVTQSQMQNAADAAALEGVRYRNAGVFSPAAGQTVDDGFASDCIRRAAANRIVRRVFDDDLDPSNGDPDYQFGAGPLLNTTGGVTNLHALDTITVPDGDRVYKPNPQMNQQNVVYGDMVGGRFCYTADPAASEGLAYADPATVVCTEAQRGDGIYARNDFNPNATPPSGPAALSSCPSPDDDPPTPWPLSGVGSLAGADNNAFLVRLRRSNELGDNDGQVDAGVASSGPALPLVFGRATTIAGDDARGGYSVRRDGLTVRATSIAQVRPALHIGLPQTTPAEPGIEPLALRDTFVATLNAVGSPVTVNLANGVICSGVIPAASIATTCTAAAAVAVGRFVAAANQAALQTVGRLLPGAAARACTPTVSGYGAVYSVMVTSGATRVIGFSRLGLSGACPAPGAPGYTATATRGISIVAPVNASAVVPGGLPLPVDTQPAEVVELLNRNLVQNGMPNYAPVLAPVLAR